MDSQKFAFVSDVHLTEADSPQWKAFLSFLTGLKADSLTDLVLLGDIFDLWVGDHQYFKDHYQEILVELKRLKQLGVEIHYFEGNHDLYLKYFFEKQLGFKVYEFCQYLDINQLRVRLEHGDEMDPTDQGYLFLRAFLRMPFVKFVNLHLPEKVVQWIGKKASEKSRKYTSTRKAIDKQQAQEIIRVHAENAFLERPFDLIITGHVHEKDDYTSDIAGQKLRSINLGSWFGDCYYFYIDQNQQKFIKV